MRVWTISPAPTSIAVIAIAGPGWLIFNTSTSAFDPLDPKVKPDLTHLIPMTRSGSTFGNVLSAEIPAAACVSGASLVLLSVDGTGNATGTPGDTLDVAAIDPGVRQVRLSIGP